MKSQIITSIEMKLDTLINTYPNKMMRNYQGIRPWESVENWGGLIFLKAGTVALWNYIYRIKCDLGSPV